MSGFEPGTLRSVSIVSPHAFKWKEIDHLVHRLGGEQDLEGWALARGGRKIVIEIGNEDLETMFDTSELSSMNSLLGGRPQGRLAILFSDSGDGFEMLMAKGLAKAIAEVWDTVLNDHLGKSTLIEPPR